MGPLPLVCFSHLRWSFVFQRPQHLMSRFAAVRPVWFVEEPEYGTALPSVRVSRQDGVQVVTPQLTSADHAEDATRRLLGAFFRQRGVTRALQWVYTPMMLPLLDAVEPSAVVYDCMDELSAFKFAPPQLVERERALMARADVVFTGGPSLFEARRSRHRNVHGFPSSVDVAHFSRARTGLPEPDDQRGIGQPRIGYAGVIDERLDLDLIAQVAEARPDWQIVMLGPTAKVDPAALPQAQNIHYLGMKAYADLPAYMAGWRVGLLPFALNESTRFISPTKTPEYLAAGRPVVSTPIRDVVTLYGDRGLARVAATPAAFIDAVAAAIDDGGVPPETDQVLAQMSWDVTWRAMRRLVAESETIASAVPVTPLLAPPAPLGVR